MEGGAGAAPLVTPAAAISEEDAAALAATEYGLEPIAVTRLANEKDQIFRLDAEAGPTVLRIAHPGDAAGALDLATQALLHLEVVAPGLPFERSVRALDGRPTVELEDAAGKIRLARMTTFLPGSHLASVRAGPTLLRHLGETYAQVGLALACFSHPEADRFVLWDIRQASQVRELVPQLEDRPHRDTLLAVFDRFETSVLPRLEPLRRQFLHNDLTGANVLIGPTGSEVVGLLDVGDATVTQLVNEVAIAVTEILADGPDPLAPALDLLAGYHGVSPLTAEELTLLYDLVRTRIAMHIAISEWRAARFPENRAYIGRKLARLWPQLEAMDPTAASVVGQRLLVACEVG
jgi:hydroxylysine kinase